MTVPCDASLELMLGRLNDHFGINDPFWKLLFLSVPDTCLHCGIKVDCGVDGTLYLFLIITVSVND